MARRLIPVHRAAWLTAGLLALAASGPAALAQPADLPVPAATTTQYPPGVKVAQTPVGAVYVHADGRTLYGMDMRTLIRWSPDPAQYCTGACTEQWEPLLAPAGATVNIAYPKSRERPEGFVDPQKAPDWTVIQGPQGPQWVYKGWHVVYVRKGDQPGSTAFDGAEDRVWNTLKFVPPEPKVSAPGNLSAILVDGEYALADAEGRVLFAGTCATDCAAWKPLAAGLASRGIGPWSVDRSGDVPQWRYQGQPVFVGHDDDKTAVPAGAKVLRP